MTVVAMTLEVETEADTEAVADTLRRELEDTEGVERAIVSEDTDRGIMASIAVVSATILLIDQGVTLASKVWEIVKKARKSGEDKGGLHKATIQIGDTKIDVTTASEEELRQALTALSQSG